MDKSTSYLYFYYLQKEKVYGKKPHTKQSWRGITGDKWLLKLERSEERRVGKECRL